MILNKYVIANNTASHIRRTFMSFFNLYNCNSIKFSNIIINNKIKSKEKKKKNKKHAHTYFYLLFKVKKLVIISRTLKSVYIYNVNNSHTHES